MRTGSVPSFATWTTVSRASGLPDCARTNNARLASRVFPLVERNLLAGSEYTRVASVTNQPVRAPGCAGRCPGGRPPAARPPGGLAVRERRCDCGAAGGGGGRRPGAGRRRRHRRRGRCGGVASRWRRQPRVEPAARRGAARHDRRRRRRRHGRPPEHVVALQVHRDLQPQRARRLDPQARRDTRARAAGSSRSPRPSRRLIQAVREPVERFVLATSPSDRRPQPAAPRSRASTARRQCSPSRARAVRSPAPPPQHARLEREGHAAVQPTLAFQPLNNMADPFEPRNRSGTSNPGTCGTSGTLANLWNPRTASSPSSTRDPACESAAAADPASRHRADPTATSAAAPARDRT